MAGRGGLTVEDLQHRLSKDEEWLRELNKTLNRSATLAASVSQILDDFSDKVDTLSNNVHSLYSKTSVVQREQQNVKKLMSIVDATMQFHGKTLDFENTIRDGNLLHNLDEYLEKMNSLKEAIAFFSSHATYQGQLNHMTQIFDTGYEFLETEFGNLVKTSSISLDPAKIFESLDEDYEMTSFHAHNLSTIKDPQKLSPIASWLMSNSSSSSPSQFLKYYTSCRGDNMLKTLKVIGDQMGGSSHFKGPKSKFIKSALKKAAEKITDKQSEDSSQHKESTVAIVLFMFSTTLILIQLETEACSAVFSDVKVEAALLRQIISDAWPFVINHILKVVETFEGNFAELFPLVKFFISHANQTHSLCENIGEVQAFSILKASICNRSVKLISESVDHLNNDHSRFVPKDGNVHHITSSTINFLKLLAQNRAVVNYVYEENSAVTVEFPKLFSQITHALDGHLRNKSTIYSDSTLGALFMYNNLSYINNCLQSDRLLASVLPTDEHEQMIASYHIKINEYLKRYMSSWSKVTSVFNSADAKKAPKAVYSSFNKEFESMITAQRNYCLANISMAPSIRKKIKELVLRPYVEFSTRNTAETSDSDRVIKYDAESLELIIDRLFDIAY